MHLLTEPLLYRMRGTNYNELKVEVRVMTISEKSLSKALYHQNKSRLQPKCFMRVILNFIQHVIQTLKLL